MDVPVFRRFTGSVTSSSGSNRGAIILEIFSILLVDADDCRGQHWCHVSLEIWCDAATAIFSSALSTTIRTPATRNQGFW